MHCALSLHEDICDDPVVAIRIDFTEHVCANPAALGRGPMDNDLSGRFTPTRRDLLRWAGAASAAAAVGAVVGKTGAIARAQAAGELTVGTPAAS